MQTPLKPRIVVTVFLLALLTLSTTKIVSATTTPGNQTTIDGRDAGGGNMTFIGNMTGGKSMTMPGGNMTFGASLQNAKMHLMEAIMDLRTGNIKGAMIEMNLTDQGIKMHEQEIKSMMMGVKDMMMQMKGNSTYSPMVSKNVSS